MEIANGAVAGSATHPRAEEALGVVKYGTALEADQFVVVARGTVEHVVTARRILERTSAVSIEEHLPAGAA